MIICLVCQSTFPTREELFQHVKIHKRKRRQKPKTYGCEGDDHPYIECENGDVPLERFQKIEAFRGFLQCYRNRTEEVYLTPRDYFNNYRAELKKIFTAVLQQNRNLKFQISTVIKFMRQKFDENLEETCEHYVNSRMSFLYGIQYFDSMLSDYLDEVDNRVSVFEQNGSGWKIDRVLGCDIRFGKFASLKGGGNIALPKQLKRKRGAINLDCTNQNCFKYACLCAIHHKDIKHGNVNQLYVYRKFENWYNFDTVKGQMSLKQIPEFESQNSRIAINVFGYDEDERLHIKYISKK